MHPGHICVTVPTMSLSTYQSCYSNDGWQMVRIQSDSDKRIYYPVFVSPWKAEESICDCPSWLYSIDGKCKHQERAWNKVCRWTGEVGEQHFDACPSCGGPVKYEVSVHHPQTD